MKLLYLIAFAAAFVCSSVQAQTSKPAVPPLLDRELFFGNPEISNAQISPDGKFVSFLKPWSGTMNIWVKKVEDSFSAATLLTDEPKRPISEYFWSWDGKYVIYVKDHDGDENFNAFAVDPAAKPATGAAAPPSRNLTPLKGILSLFEGDSKHDPDVIYLGINDRDPAWHDLYKLQLSSGKLTLVRKNTDRVSRWFFDLAGNLRLAQRVAVNGDTEILRVDADKLTPIYTCNVYEQIGLLRFHKDGKRLFISTNKGTGTDLATLSLLDVETGKTELVDSDPLNRVDLDYATFSEATDDLVETGYKDARLRHYSKDDQFDADHKWLEQKLPGMELDLTSRSTDEQTWLVKASSDTEPGEGYLFDRKAHTLTFQYKVRENVPREALAAMVPITYKSSDGLEIPAYLTLPRGVEAKGLPLIVYPHGGPWARDNWSFDRFAQFFANRGYAVLQPNFRGSTGYGKKFLDAGNHEWGRKMQDDLTFGVQDLVAKGIADPKRVGIAGISYGGYATLAGVTYTPDLYAAAIDVCGPSELASLFETIPPYWEVMRRMLYDRVADPNNPEGVATLKAESPLNFIDRIKTPLMVVQGENDPRVKKAQAERIVIAMRDRHLPIQYILAPDEGHGFHRPINNMAMLMSSEKFLAQYLGGRCQEGGTPETVARVAEITIDPAKLAPTAK